MFESINTAATGMTAERLRMDVIADNLANASTTRDADEEPFRRKVVNLESRSNSRRRPTLRFARFGSSAPRPTTRGVRVQGIVEAHGEPRRIHDPDHPDADEEGYVTMPNVKPIEEMVDMITASRSYEANVTMIDASKRMIRQAIEIMQ